jgi:hypothetical protein
MKMSVLGLMLAISVLLTVPAGARGRYPAILAPSYPYPSYCKQCFGTWQASAQPLLIVLHHRESLREGANATSK